MQVSGPLNVHKSGGFVHSSDKAFLYNFILSSKNFFGGVVFYSNQKITEGATKCKSVQWSIKCAKKWGLVQSSDTICFLFVKKLFSIKLSLVASIS